MNRQYTCVKCESKEYIHEEITTSGGLSKFFDVQNKKFEAVSCSKCGFTEFYKKETNIFENFLDFIGSR